MLSTVAPAVAKAAMESGEAQQPITNWEAYTNNLNKRLGLDNQVMRVIGNKARRDPKRIVFAETDNVKILKAAQSFLMKVLDTLFFLGMKPVLRILQLIMELISMAFHF